MFDLKTKVNHYEEVSEGNKDDEVDDTSNAAGSQDDHALFLTATALVTRRRALRLRHHRLHHLQWVHTAEKAQRSLLRGGTATRTTLVLVTCSIAVFVLFFFLIYLRRVRLVRNLFSVVCNGFFHATACVMCVSLSLYYDVKFDGSYYVMHFLVLISYRYIN